MIKSTAKYALILPMCLLLACMLGTALMAHEGEEHDEGEGTSESTVTAPAPVLDSIYAVINADYQKIKPIMVASCYDCHSTLTDYPWYHKLPLVKGLMDGHIKKGRKHFDMTNDFPFASEHSQLDLLKDIRSEIEEGEMPLLSYRLLHWGSAIDGDDQDSVFAWIDSARAMLLRVSSDSSEVIP